MAGADGLVVHMTNVQSQKVIALVHSISLKKRLGKINSGRIITRRLTNIKPYLESMITNGIE